jgi:hypothetical protein
MAFYISGLASMDVLYGVAVKVASMSHHSLLKFCDLKSQIYEAIASVEGTLQNVVTSSFIALSSEL